MHTHMMSASRRSEHVHSSDCGKCKWCWNRENLEGTMEVEPRSALDCTGHASPPSLPGQGSLTSRTRPIIPKYRSCRGIGCQTQIWCADHDSNW